MDRNSYKRAEIQALFDKLAKMGKEGEWEFMFTAGEDALTRFANNYIHQNVSRANINLSVRAIIDKKSGKASTNNLSDESLQRTLSRALKAAKVAHPDDNILPLPTQQEYNTIDNYDDETAGITPAQRAEKVHHIIERCRASNFSAAGIIDNEMDLVALGNTKGLFAYHTGTRASVSLTVKGPEGSGWAQDQAYKFSALNCEQVAEKAVEICTRNQNPQDIQPGEFTVILTPEAVAELLMFVGFTGFGAQSYIEGRSFLAGKLGQKLFNEKLSLKDNAYHPGSTGLPFDFEGLPKKTVELVVNGEATNLVHDRKTAQKFNTESTGHALPPPNPRGPIPLNLEVDSGKQTMDEIIQNTPKGIMVTHFHYTNLVDPKRLIITGMTRDGTFLIEDGKVSHPVKNMRFTENMVKAFSNIDSITSDRKVVSSFWGRTFYVPAMKIDNFNFSSTTQF